jgi:hypothetical protein
MKGHIRERSPGHWAIVIDSVDVDGKRRRKWSSFVGGKREAQVECARLIAQRQNGGDVDFSRATVDQYFDRWLEHMQTQVSLRTHERYSQILHLNAAPLIGAEPLAKLQPARISHAYAQALAHGRRDGTGGLGGFRREVQPRRQHWFLNEKSGFPFRTPAFCSVSRGQRRLGEKEYRAPSVTPGVALRPRTQGPRECAGRNASER